MKEEERRGKKKKEEERRGKKKNGEERRRKKMKQEERREKKRKGKERRGKEKKELLATKSKKISTLLDLCVSSLRRGHANLLCIVPILTDDPRRESNDACNTRWAQKVPAFFVLSSA